MFFGAFPERLISYIFGQRGSIATLKFRKYEPPWSRGSDVDLGPVMCRRLGICVQPSMTYDRNSLSGLNISRYTKDGELPALIGVKEIAIGRPDVASGRRTRPAAQHELVAHELAIVLAQRPGSSR